MMEQSILNEYIPKEIETVNVFIKLHKYSEQGKLVDIYNRELKVNDWCIYANDSYPEIVRVFKLCKVNVSVLKYDSFRKSYFDKISVTPSKLYKLSQGEIDYLMNL